MRDASPGFGDANRSARDSETRVHPAWFVIVYGVSTVCACVALTVLAVQGIAFLGG